VSRGGFRHPPKKTPHGPGWPKMLPCLGYCGQDRESYGPADRTCDECKLRQRYVRNDVTRFAQHGLNQWELS